MVALFAATWRPFVVAPRFIFLNVALAVLPFAFVPVAALVPHLARAGRNAGLAACLAIVALSSAPLLILAMGAASDLPPFGGFIERFRPDPRLEGNAAMGPTR